MRESKGKSLGLHTYKREHAPCSMRLSLQLYNYPLLGRERWDRIPVDVRMSRRGLAWSPHDARSGWSGRGLADADATHRAGTIRGCAPNTRTASRGAGVTVEMEPILVAAEAARCREAADCGWAAMAGRRLHGSTLSELRCSHCLAKRRPCSSRAETKPTNAASSRLSTWSMVTSHPAPPCSSHE
eukprot:5532011-Prymnesium_polylepis.1